MSVSEFFLKTAAVFIAPVRYVEKGVENARDNLKEDAEEIIANVMKLAIFLLMAFFVLLFLNMLIAAVLNDALESNYLGYVFVTAFYTIVLIILWSMRKLDAKDGFLRRQARKMISKSRA